eukprot:CAMPEP_0197683140 /NCGR_PEP_ID=MMETSP1338-20131121/97495_1 /TAXON_ID=43686 ORGANISM="Pelagodinium beii, Strain RCC1491" /NCGR_SAMPLE_ID=MMETSP1338 /ASSEMBLY_ACC=CAM_ASM_000754 /LENGTH=45 /DNA_ID= /DNA_START= /DNA_END= /DNA_ORIENTATION=
MTAIAVAAIASIEEFAAQNVANLAWACAKLRFQDTPLLAALSSQA